ncbi:hypothetical protein [Xenorhabdus sp. SGI246]
MKKTLSVIIFSILSFNALAQPLRTQRIRVMEYQQDLCRQKSRVE